MTASGCAVVTGASRGLGLEFARQLLDAGRAVVALARQPDAAQLVALGERAAGRLHRLACDVTSEPGLRTAAAEVAGRFPAVDLLINNAGVMGNEAEDVEGFDVDAALQVMRVNAFGPVLAARAFLPALAAGKRPVVANITSLMGSIGDNASGGYWAYRMSKAALNMATRNLAHELAADAITVVALHPGWVRTDMGGPRAPLAPAESVSGMLAVLAALHPEQSGSFLRHDGQRAPW